MLSNKKKWSKDHAYSKWLNGNENVAYWKVLTCIEVKETRKYWQIIT